MKDYIAERVLLCADFVLQNNATIRCAAKEFCVSKSTAHKDLSERLLELDKGLFEQVKEVLEDNLAQRHIRGGIATYNKYKK